MKHKMVRTNCWNDQIALLLLNYHWSIILCAAQNLCFQCSDLNIEVHYGAFFNNPRILQDDNSDSDEQPRCVSERDARIRICRDPCYTLNVTTFDIRTQQLLPFGMSHGCSTMVLPSNRIQSNGCHHSNILLKTTPAHPLQTQYCFCTGEACNAIKPVLTRINSLTSNEQNCTVINYNQTVANITSTARSTARSMHRFGVLPSLLVLLISFAYFILKCYSGKGI